MNMNEVKCKSPNPGYTWTFAGLTMFNYWFSKAHLCERASVSVKGLQTVDIFSASNSKWRAEEIYQPQLSLETVFPADRQHHPQWMRKRDRHTYRQKDKDTDWENEIDSLKVEGSSPWNYVCFSFYNVCASVCVCSW